MSKDTRLKISDAIFRINADIDGLIRRIARLDLASKEAERCLPESQDQLLGAYHMLGLAKERS